MMTHRFWIGSFRNSGIRLARPAPVRRRPPPLIPIDFLPERALAGSSDGRDAITLQRGVQRCARGKGRLGRSPEMVGVAGSNSLSPEPRARNEAGESHGKAGENRVQGPRHTGRTRQQIGQAVQWLSNAGSDFGTDIENSCHRCFSGDRRRTLALTPVVLLDVFLDHAPGIELRDECRHGAPDHADPPAWNAVLVTFIKTGDDMLDENLV